MTYQEIQKTIKTLINQESAEMVAMYTEAVDENLNSTYYTLDGLMETVIDAIEETHEDDEYSDYKTLTKIELYNIYTQVK